MYVMTKFWFIVWFAGILQQVQASKNSVGNDCFEAKLSGKCKDNKITFHLYNYDEKNVEIEYELNSSISENIEKAPFQPQKIKFIIHGHMEHRNDFFMRPLREEYLKANKNVIHVQYTDLSSENCYRVGVQNSQIVAQCSTEMLLAIIEHAKIPVSLADIHIIGVSLGGQIAGQMPNYLTDGKKFSRITGLDPANEGFFDRYELDDYILTPNDAEFVDVIHTNSGSLGKFRPMGHADFYANSGITQPGCGEDNDPCSHMRAVILFLESIPIKKEIIVIQCSYLELKFLQLCESVEIVTFGENINQEKTRGIYFFDTNAVPPYLRSDVNTTYPVYDRHLNYAKPKNEKQPENASKKDYFYELVQIM